MKRKEFITSLLGTLAMTQLRSASPLLSLFNEETDYIYPVLFVGHGSPMNGIEDNSFSQQWKKQVEHLPTPKAVLVISAHWLTNGTHITAMEAPKTIHDFGGFPPELYAVNYPAPGSPELAKIVQATVQSLHVHENHEWGLDHGTWTVVRHMYPNANIPVLQLSIDYKQTGEFHYKLAQELKTLRKKGVLIIGSGNMVHNLGRVAWDKLNVKNFGYDWAIESHELFKKLILNKNHTELIHYTKLGQAVQLAVPTPDHYYPLLYTLGLSEEKDSIQFFNDELVGGSLNMTSVQFG